MNRVNESTERRRRRGERRDRDVVLLEELFEDFVGFFLLF